MANLLFISADKKIALGAKNNFYYALQGLAKEFDNIAVICPTDEKGVSIKLGDKITIYPSPFTSKNKEDAWKKRKFIVEKGLSLHAKTPFDLIVSDLRAPFFNQTKAGIELSKKLNLPHAVEFLVTPGLPKSSSSAEVVQKMLVKDFLQLHKHQITKYRVNSLAETKEFLHGELNIDLEKIKAIPPYYIHGEIFKDLKQEREVNSLLFAGSLNENAGLYLLLDAIKIVKSHQNVKIYIVGEGPLRDALKQYAKEYGLEKNAIFLRWPVTLKSLALQYNRATAFVMPYFSRLNYRICIEAMSCKTPTLIADHASNPEFLEDRKNTLLFDYTAESLAKKIMEIFKTPDLASQLAINGSDTAEFFEYETAIKRYADLYAGLLASKDQSQKL